MRRTSIALLIGIALTGTFAVGAAADTPPRPIDETRGEAAGIRKLVGQHVALYTDVPINAAIERLTADFDQAVPQWAEYFRVPIKKTADWKARAYLIADRRRFDALGLMPAGHDQFINGISVGSELWLYDQQTDYYRRHLLLHEGTHVFMNAFLGGCGPGWYMEGAAELLATHRLNEQTGRLTLRVMPRDRAEVPMLGRIKLVRDAFADGRAQSFPAVMKIDNRRQLGNEAYAWSWAAARFLDSHPRYRQRFRQLQRHVLDEDFNDVVRREYADDWSDLTTEWQAVVAALDHGYDFERMAIRFQRGEPLVDSSQKVTIVADRGWQSTGVWLEADRRYRLTASGRYQIATEEKGGVTRPWPCEPGGITIEYQEGRPLGILLAAVDARSVETADASFSHPISVGLHATVAPTSSGTLYLRVNDSGGRLDDNRGAFTVTIESAAAERR